MMYLNGFRSRSGSHVTAGIFSEPGNSTESRRYYDRVSTKVLVPMLVLVFISTLVATLTLIQDRRTYDLLVAEKKSELIRNSRALYEETRRELISVAELVAENPVVQNGLLIYDQFDILNTISGYLGHSGIDVINIYDLEGLVFARAQAPSYFGDRDELTPFILDLLHNPTKEPDADTAIGILQYHDRPTLISVRLIRGVSGPAGAVVVGYTIHEEFLSGFVPERHTGLILTRVDELVLSTVDEKDLTIHDSMRLVEEAGIYDAALHEFRLVTNDAKFFPDFWKAPLSIMMIAGFASLGSIVLAFIFLFKTVVRPVRHLTAVAEQQVSGDLSARIRLDSHDELGRLGDILNLLTSKLQHTLMMQNQTIAERSRLNAELERRVMERTRELQQELNERKRAQADLVRAKEDAERANISKSRFLAAASHDLRQPVHAMSLFVSQLAEEAPSRKWSAVVRNVDLCLESLREMFEKILDISKLEAGVIEPQIEDFPISRLFDRLQREFEGLAGEKGIDLRTVHSTVIVRSDPSLLHRILGNLVCNSIRHTKDSRVLLGCRRKKEGVRIEVWDTAGGIPEKDIGHIFKEFYRSSNPSFGNQQENPELGLGLGLGLGLSIVEHTAQLLKHPLSVCSEPGRHTVFSIEVAYGANRDNAQDGYHDGSNMAVAGAGVMIIDDDGMALEALKSTLENWGCRVVAAASVKDALHILSERRWAFDVLITDYLLDDQQTGIDLLEKAEGIFGHPVPSIVLSGVSSRRMEREAQNCGYMLLYKPVSATHLRCVLVGCLQANRGRLHGAHEENDRLPLHPQRHHQ